MTQMKRKENLAISEVLSNDKTEENQIWRDQMLQGNKELFLESNFFLIRQRNDKSKENFAKTVAPILKCLS